MEAQTHLFNLFLNIKSNVFIKVKFLQCCIKIYFIEQKTVYGIIATCTKH